MSAISEIQTPLLDNSENETVTKVEDNLVSEIVNTARMGRIRKIPLQLRSYKSKSDGPTAPIVEPPIVPSIPLPPINPDLNTNDVRLVISIRLETREKVLYCRDPKDDSFKFVVPSGNVNRARAADINAHMSSITSDILKAFYDNLPVSENETDPNVEEEPLKDVPFKASTMLPPATFDNDP